jgi:hypothetical protein
VGDILREYGDAFRREYVLTDDQFKVMRCLEVCRTSALGGHLETCDHCGQTRPVFNSCRNRHCPKCRRLATLEWFTARQQELLPVGYFHNVFTLPHELNPLAEANPRIIYRQLFRSVSATLLKFGADPQWGLGGRLGFTTVLHTWDQQLQYHIHLHCIIAGGALSFDGNKWLPAKEYLFPIKELSRAYRAHFLHGLRCTCRRGDLILPGGMAEPGRFDAFTEYLAGKEWVCFSREPFATPDKVLEYLSRYTHRIAISNRRLLHVENGQVTFQFRDRKDNNRIKERTITAEEFIGRFLQHVMPRGMPRMRHYGFLSNPRKRKCLPQCRALLGQAEPEKKEMPTNRVELLLELAGYDWTICPKCKEGKMIVTERWQRQKALFSPHTRVIYPKLPRPKDSS